MSATQIWQSHREISLIGDLKKLGCLLIAVPRCPVRNVRGKVVIDTSHHVPNYDDEPNFRMVDKSDEKGDIFPLWPEFFFSDWELENKLHLCFLNFFVCLFRLSLCGKDFASFAYCKLLNWLFIWLSSFHCTKNEVSIRDFFSKCDQIYFLCPVLSSEILKEKQRLA